MKKLNFNENGNLSPCEVIKIGYDQFIHEFATSQPTPKRIELIQDFSNFLAFINLFISTNFCLWIAGSFVTKRTSPDDIDVLLFLDKKTFDLNKDQMKLDFLHGRSKSMFNVDLYILPILDESDSDFTDILEKKIEWENNFIQYSNDIPCQGFVEIKFGTE